MSNQIAADANVEQSIAAMSKLNEQALEGTHVRAITADDVLALYGVLVEKFEQHGFEKDHWPTSRRSQIRRDKKAS